MGGDKLGFAENFLLSGVAAAVSKTAAAPIERVKLLVQNQGEMLKQGILTEPYKGVIDCTQRTLKSEGIGAFWRGIMIDEYLLAIYCTMLRKMIIFIKFDDHH